MCDPDPSGLRVCVNFEMPGSRCINFETSVSKVINFVT